MKRKRERLDVIQDILVAIRDHRGPAKPTHILYKSNLSSQMLKEYLAELLDSKLISESPDKKGNVSYVLEDRAYSFLDECRRIRAFLESYGLE